MELEMSNEERWNAVIDCDKSWDGLFYYAVKTTGVFCRPSCKAKAPLKKNTLFFNNIEDALKAGFRPCKICRPDVNDYNYDPNRGLIEKAREILDNSFDKHLDLNSIAQKLGFSSSHLTRLFKQYYGISENKYIIKLRIDKARELLKFSNSDIIAIAYDVGFKSLSNFYKCFKEQVGTTPKEYRIRG